MVKQMKELGIKAKFIAGDGVCSAEWPKLAGGAAEGQYCTQAGVPPDKMANAKDFVTRFTAKYGPIQVYAPYSYDAAMTLIAAMQKANSTDPAKYLPELAKISYDGITAKIEFDEHGDTKNGAITLYTVKDGKLGADGDERRRQDREARCGRSRRTCAGRDAPAMAPAAAAAMKSAGTRRRSSDKQARPQDRNGAPRGAVSICRHAAACLGRGIAAAWATVENRPSPGTRRGATGAVRGYIPAADHQRSHAGQRLRAGRTRLHDGLRHHRPDQFRARRSRDDRRDGRPVGHHRPGRLARHAACGSDHPRRPDGRDPGLHGDRATAWKRSPTGRCAGRRASRR